MRFGGVIVLSVGVLLVGCGEEPLRPSLPPSGKPLLSFIPYDTSPLGAVAGETIITIPAGATRDSAVLYVPGALTGVSSLEVLSNVTLSGGGTIPANSLRWAVSSTTIGRMAISTADRSGFSSATCRAACRTARRRSPLS